MKKIFMRVFPFCLCLVLGACSGGNKKATDAVSQKVINEISSIGDVTLDDEQKITDTLELYKTLTDNQKDQVSNYIDLLNAQEKIEQLKEAEKAEKETYLKIEREYYDYVDYAISTLKRSLKQPNSLVLNEIIVRKFYYEHAKDSAIQVEIDYTANNGLGNPLTNYYFWTSHTGTGIEESYESFSNSQYSYSGNSSKYIYKWGEDFYATLETQEDHLEFIFKLDMDDYNNQ